MIDVGIMGFAHIQRQFELVLQKSAKGVHLQDLALYLANRREIALSEARAFRTK